MRHPLARSAARPLCAGILFSVSFMSLTLASAQAQSAQPAKSPVIHVGIVFDERVAALRTGPDPHALIVQRLRRGHRVYLLRGRVDPLGKYYRVAISRRTRGWIHREAVAFPDPALRDQAEKILRLAQATDDVEKLALCRLIVSHFRSSPLAPQALALMAAEADSIASKILKRAQRRLENAGMVNPAISTSDYFLNEVALDRYNKLGVNFFFDEATGLYAYDCAAWREIIHRFPSSPEATTARARMSNGPPIK